MQIKHILFPVDFSAESHRAKEHVEWLSATFAASVTLLHVFEIPTAWYAASEAPTICDAALFEFPKIVKQDLDNYEIKVPPERVKRVLREGSPAAHLAQLVKEENPDLVVMATHGNGMFRRMLLGSVAMKVLHDVDVPVWTCGRCGQRLDYSVPWRPGIRRILCPVDVSDETTPLLGYAADIGEMFGAEVELVHTVPETATRPSRYLDASTHRALEQAAREDLARLQEQAGTQFPLTITGNYISDDVLNLTEERGADLLLIGRGHLQGRLGTLRSHAFELIRTAPVPVLSFCLSRADRQQKRKQLHSISAEESSYDTPL